MRQCETAPEEGHTPASAADATHFVALGFTPATLVTVTDVDGERFQKDVTGGAEAGTGTYSVGYGHDETADELTWS